MYPQLFIQGISPRTGISPTGTENRGNWGWDNRNPAWIFRHTVWGVGAIEFPKFRLPRSWKQFDSAVKEIFESPLKREIIRNVTRSNNVRGKKMLPDTQRQLSSSTQKRLATSPRPSFATLHAQTPTFAHSSHRYWGQRIEDPPRNFHRTQEPAVLSFPTGRNPQCDQEPSGTHLTLLGWSGYVKDISVRNKDESLLARRSNDRFR